MNGAKEGERPAMGKVSKRLVRMSGEGELYTVMAHKFPQITDMMLFYDMPGGGPRKIGADVV
jgi:hypothetical protein